MHLIEENMCVWAITQNLLTCFAKFAQGFFFFFNFSSWKKLVKLGNVCSGFPSFLSLAASCCVLLRLTVGWIPNHLLGILGDPCAPSLGAASFFHPTSLCLFRMEILELWIFLSSLSAYTVARRQVACCVLHVREQGCCSPSFLRLQVLLAGWKH